MYYDCFKLVPIKYKSFSKAKLWKMQSIQIPNDSNIHAPFIPSIFAYRTHHLQPNFVRIHPDVSMSTQRSRTVMHCHTWKPICSITADERVGHRNILMCLIYLGVDGGAVTMCGRQTTFQAKRCQVINHRRLFSTITIYILTCNSLREGIAS